MTPGRATLAAALVWLGLFLPVDVDAQDTGVARSDILVLDPERMFEETALGREMLAEHQAERDALAAQNRSLEAELEAEEKRLTDIRAETSPEDFRELADAFDARVQEIRRASERRVRDLERDRERLPAEFLRQVDGVILEIMSAAGGIVLLDQRTVILRADVIDITDRAIEGIDAAFPVDDVETDPPEPDTSGQD